MVSASLRLFLYSTTFLLLNGALKANPTEFHVAQSGKTGASGTANDPLPSLGEAVAAIKALPQDKKAAGVTVLLSGGLYSLPEGVTLDSSCSGSSAAPVVITGEPGATPTLTAGRPVTPECLEPVKDASVADRLDQGAKSHIRQIDLAKLGVPALPPLPDVFKTDWRPLMLVFGTNALPIARWPKGEYGFTTMKNVIESGDKTHGGSFVYREDRPARWRQSAAEGQLWLRGFWRVPWVLSGARVRAIDPRNRTISLVKDVGGGIGSKYKKDARGRRCGDGTEPWCAVNLPEEISEPGEWAVDFKRGMVYLWPPDGVSMTSPILVAANRRPLLSLDNASHVTIKGVRFLGSVADAVEMKGGEQNLIAGCDVSHVARRGISIMDGARHKAVSNDVRETGNSGISVSGGVKETLKSAGHEILNNDVSRAANDCVEPAIHVGIGEDSQFQKSAVGIRVAHNRIHDSSNAGIRFGGCDNIFEMNEIYRIGLNSGDLGAIYGYCGFTGFGNVIRDNFVHHSMNANAYYLDDGTSGVTVKGNIAYKCNLGVLVGGGHDNHIVNNIIIECPRAGIHLDDRGTVRNYTLGNTTYGRDVRSVSPDLPPWKTRHPKLAALVAGGDTTIPKGDMVQGNLVINCPKPFDLPKPEHAHGITLKGNVTADSLSMFADAGNFDFTVKPGSALVASIPGFRAPPFREIGLQIDEFRTSLPPRDNKLLRDGNTVRRKFNSTTDIEASNSDARSKK